MISDYGGAEFWQNVAITFYKRVKKHERLRVYFANTDNHKLSAMASDIWQISLGEGGSTTDNGLALVHRDLNISVDLFYKFVGIYLSVLEEEGVKPEDLEIIEANLNRHLSGVTRSEEPKITDS